MEVDLPSASSVPLLAEFGDPSNAERPERSGGLGDAWADGNSEAGVGEEELKYCLGKASANTRRGMSSSY